MNDYESRRERTIRMRALGRKGGLATKAKKPPGYHAQLGRLGGIANAREHGVAAQLERQRIVAGKLGNAGG